jgi:DNA-binding transcriptional regulator YiaG
MAKCRECGAAGTTSERETVPYTGLPGATLVGVEVTRCSACGAHDVAIPAMDALHRELVRALAAKPVGMTGPEVRFLRSAMNLSGVELAATMGADPATLSKWENEKQPIGHQSDLLLRALAVIDLRVADFAIATFAQVGEPAGGKKSKGPTYRMAPEGKGWRRLDS